MRKIHQGEQSRLPRFVITNSSTGSGLTGLTYNSSGLTAYYVREGDNSTTAIALSAGTLGTWSSGGFVEVDSVHMPGLYELGIPNAVLASGKSTVIWLRGAANMLDCPLNVELDQANYNDAQRLGLSSLPNANPAANGGLPTVDASNNVHGLSQRTCTDASVIGTSTLTGTAQSGDGYLYLTTNLGLLGANATALAQSSSWSSSLATSLATTNTSVATILTRIPSAFSFTSGNVNANVQASAASLSFNLTGNVAGNLSGSVGSVASVGNIQSGLATTAGLASLSSQVGSPMQAGAQVDLISAPNSTAMTAIANAILDQANAIDPSGAAANTLRQAIRLVVAAVCGYVSGADTSTNVIKDTSNTKNRIVATTDVSGDRTAITYDAS